MASPPSSPPLSVGSLAGLPPSVLVANRGEIACRVFRTARRLGLATVAVVTEDDLGSAHALAADTVVRVGSYLSVGDIVEACNTSGAAALHPGYGFLSENPALATALGAAGVTFLGPSPASMEMFAYKHTARTAAVEVGVPVVPGTDVLPAVDDALHAADSLGYPVMLKAVAGGGGIGMALADTPEALTRAFRTTTSSAADSFGDGRVYMEKAVTQARHIEVQIFGDGAGECVALGERECSVQRRHQKVVEETPSPFVDDDLRARMFAAAVALGKHASYNGAGTVEFLVSGNTGAFYFLEMNTRLQVEHAITEACTGVDIVEWQMLCGGPEEASPAMTDVLRAYKHAAAGSAIECRIYCEDPVTFLPAPGVLTEVAFPTDGVRVDTWVSTGTTVTASYDPLIAKLTVHGKTRAAALAAMRSALAESTVAGTPTNLAFLSTVLNNEDFVSGTYDTSLVASMAPTPLAGFTVEAPGVLTTVQDWPGRVAAPGQDAWRVGIPPSGPMDSLSHRLANKLVGNPTDAATLEITTTGPVLVFQEDALVALCGAHFPDATINGNAFPTMQTVSVKRGERLAIGSRRGGNRGYLAVRGGMDVPLYLGSRSTLTMAGMGGHQGRALAAGDNVAFGPEPGAPAPVEGSRPPPQLVNMIQKHEDEDTWNIGVLTGPFAAPDFQTPEDVESFFSSTLTVHLNSNRMGVRLEGLPRPSWARTDGGEGGSHPSNVVDYVYPLWAINFTGDMPIAITVDGPSLGGFVCGCVAIKAEAWKLGQLAPGQKVKFFPVTVAEALDLQDRIEALIAETGLPVDTPPVFSRAVRWEPEDCPADIKLDDALLFEAPSSDEDVDLLVQIRRQGDCYVLLEYLPGGKMAIDFNARARVHALEAYLTAAGIEGLLEMAPGVISIQIGYDNTRISLPALLRALINADKHLPPVMDMVVPSRIVKLPIAVNDKWTAEALELYAKSVRPAAPYLPSNYEFVRRNNGLPTQDDLRHILLSASYMVLGLGDVYLGCPCATPIDPRHRLVNPKFNPARTMTPEGAVGIGGAFMCLYPMRSPGGYQLVGRSLPIWNAYTKSSNFQAGTPWLLRHFDQVRFYPVTEEELEHQFEAFRHGLATVEVEDSEFSLREYNAFISDPTVAAETEAFRRRQAIASAMEQGAEEAYWRCLETLPNPQPVAHEASTDVSAILQDIAGTPGTTVIRAQFQARVWQLNVKEGDAVKTGDVLLQLEAMKLEHPLYAPHDGVISVIAAAEGDIVSQGFALLAVIGSAEA